MCQRCADIPLVFEDIAQVEKRLASGRLSPVDQRLLTTGCLTNLAGIVEELCDERALEMAHDEDCVFRNTPLWDRSHPESEPILDALIWCRHAYAHHVPFFQDRESFKDKFARGESKFGPEHIGAVLAKFAGHSPDVVDEHDRADRGDIALESNLSGGKGEETQVRQWLKFQPWLSRLHGWRNLNEGRRDSVKTALASVFDTRCNVAIRFFREAVAEPVLSRTHSTSDVEED